MSITDKYDLTLSPTTRRAFLRRLVGAAGLLGASSLTGLTLPEAYAAQKAASGPLEISNWPYYISPKTVSEFEKRTGIKVAYHPDINSMADLFGKIAAPLQMGRNPSRDVIDMEDFLAARCVELKWLETINHSRIPNAKNIFPELRNPSWDPGRKYTMPYFTFLTTVAYNIKKTGRELTSINDIFDPKFKGHTSMLTSMRDTLALVMLSMGINPEHATYSDAQAAVKKIKRYVNNGQIRQFYGNNYSQALSNGDVWVAFAWSGDIPQLQKDNPDLRYMIPKEGMYRSDDNMTIPIKAPHREEAEKWINFIYEPEIYAQIVAYIQYIPVIQGTKSYVKKINPKLLDVPIVYPSSEVRKKMYSFKPLTGKEQAKWQSLFQTVIGH